MMPSVFLHIFFLVHRCTHFCLLYIWVWNYQVIEYVCVLLLVNTAKSFLWWLLQFPLPLVMCENSSFFAFLPEFGGFLTVFHCVFISLKTELNTFLYMYCPFRYPPSWHAYSDICSIFLLCCFKKSNYSLYSVFEE